MLSHWFGIATGLVLASILFGLAHMITPTYAVIAALVAFFWLAVDSFRQPARADCGPCDVRFRSIGVFFAEHAAHACVDRRRRMK